MSKHSRQLPVGNSVISIARYGLRPEGANYGGARRDRTDDLMLAKHALYQLSYGPDWYGISRHGIVQEVVGPGRVELPTSRLSGVRSNHLSYGPAAQRWKAAPWARDSHHKP